jgi:tetratricopeptide (TPR) repeat protein
MARKKRKPGGNEPKRRRRQPTGDVTNLPDPRSLEGSLRQFVRSELGEAGSDTPMDRAQAVMDRAFAERDPDRRVRLAKEALEIWPDCADAYVLLAEHAPSRKAALELHEKGVAAGERALGAETFREDVGHFWGVLETRPYMRARLGLAHSLWTAGRRDEAIGHLQDLLRLNPGDNQGVRYTLAGFLLFLDRDDDLARLLEQYPDEATATWAYTKALLAFRREGDTIDARRSLKAAKKTNKHVPAYLTGQKYPPPEQPGYYGLGDENEALVYIGSFLATWRDTAGAIAWLRANIKPKKRAEPPHPTAPPGFVKEWLNKHLPQQDDVWQADIRPMPTWARIGGEMVRPRVILVTSRTNDLVLAHQVVDTEPSPALLWETLVAAMRHPVAGKPHRPAEIQVRPGEAWQTLQPHVEEIGVGLVQSDDLDQLDAVFAEMSRHVGGEPRAGLLDMPGVTPERVASFYEAAASFFRHAPWKKVGYEAAIKVECDRFESGPWYAVLMGQSGLTIGLALYDDISTLQRMWSDNQADEENARQTVATGVTFGEEWETPVADVDAAKRFGWPVARPDAYPEVFHKERGMSMRPPLLWELDLVEACLKSVPDFVTRRRQDDPTRGEFTTTMASGELKLTLSWVVSEGES